MNLKQIQKQISELKRQEAEIILSQRKQRTKEKDTLKVDTYKRKLEDWQRLCMKCHWEYDKKNGLRKTKKCKTN